MKNIICCIVPLNMFLFNEKLVFFMFTDHINNIHLFDSSLLPRRPKIYTIKYHVKMFVILHHPIMHQSLLPSMPWSCPHHFLPLQDQLNLFHVQSFVFHQPLRQLCHFFFVSCQYFLCPVVRLLQWYKQHFKTTITPCVILVN